ncbi:hypothetical protein M501DRAFT_1005218 [Patellaria atrata CBS 101060]|uniref:Uncharacterized protein n=1 Tax=Patellaria atrata CBS 101060 TaxID=1346257 RepID=A0A9P4SAM5_9PEZI|nr:hypothetical protein M501DRAFT_1005218 [Patellaria atrata CBS 101060]
MYIDLLPLLVILTLSTNGATVDDLMSTFKTLPGKKTALHDFLAQLDPESSKVLLHRDELGRTSLHYAA